MVRDRGSHRAEEPNTTGHCMYECSHGLQSTVSVSSVALASSPSRRLWNRLPAVHVCASTHVRTCVCLCTYVCMYVSITVSI